MASVEQSENHRDTVSHPLNLPSDLSHQRWSLSDTHQMLASSSVPKYTRLQLIMFNYLAPVQFMKASTQEDNGLKQILRWF